MSNSAVPSYVKLKLYHYLLATLWGILFLGTTGLYGQRPDVVYLNDSSRLAGRIEITENTRQIILKRKDQSDITLLPSTADRLIKYNPNSGKLEMEVRSLVTDEGNSLFVKTPKYNSETHAVYRDLAGKSWYQRPGKTSLSQVPTEKEAYRQFFVSTPGFREPKVGARRALIRKRIVPRQLISYLNGDGFRITPGAMRLSIAYGSWVPNELTDDNFLRIGSRMPIDEEIFGNNFGFRPPADFEATYFSVRYDYNFPLSSNGKIDVSFGTGYRFQRVTGNSVSDAFDDLTVEASSAGLAHLLMAGTSMNYRFQFASFNGYLGLGAFIETPIKQRHLLYNFIRDQGDIQPFSLAYRGAYTTITFPTLELGIEHSISRALWLGLFLRSGLRYSVIESANPFFSLGTSINY